MLNEVKSRFSGKTHLIKIVFLSFVVLEFSTSLSLAQDTIKTTTKKHKSEMKEMKMDRSMNMGNDENMKSDHSSPVAYKGVIDLQSIDENKDGKVYQCPMDFNVLSDKPGIDPKCGMKLKEVSLEQAKKNLTEHGFKVRKLGVTKHLKKVQH
jgi:hypothetical protein